MAATSTIEITSPSAEELPRFVEAVMTAFLEAANEHDQEMFTSQLDPAHQYWALDGDVPVGTAGTYDIRMRVPGGELPIAGVTLVGVHASHRRRGILTQMMRRQLDDAYERGEPIAVLWASPPPVRRSRPSATASSSGRPTSRPAGRGCSWRTRRLA